MLAPFGLCSFDMLYDEFLSNAWTGVSDNERKNELYLLRISAGGVYDTQHRLQFTMASWQVLCNISPRSSTSLPASILSSDSRVGS
jgi:hypothetical protein